MVKVNNQVRMRNMMLRFPLVYKMLQTPSAWRLRNRFASSYEPEFAALVQVLADVKVNSIVDVGGNFGQSVVQFRKLFPAADIVSVEPNPILAAALAKTFKGDSHVSVMGSALAENPSVLTLHIPSYNGVPFPGLASLDEQEAWRWLGADTIPNFVGSKRSMMSVQVPCVTFDMLNVSPQFVKIDVEGAEVGVLVGAKQTLAENKPVLLIECRNNLANVQAVLVPLGYETLELVNGKWVTSQGRNVNQLFV